ncbi:MULTISPECIES: 4Fe-4S binding protein [unclassified Archaeoglobus]|uniref:4Fe-4S binding protein n=1 Tax=unclassified Archaeoglobus TaxID=2643606 RepID=UPI0025BC3944|nr:MULTISPECIES: 4Fe-4S binding protein [unclassified Archaeoglobus]
MDVERDLEMLEDEKFKYIQRAKGEVRELIYDYKWCNGCGICVYACPVNAIELGPVHDIAVGLDMPPVIIDHLKCAYCGICYSFCPFTAFEFYINGEKVDRSSLTLSPVMYTYKYETCRECTLCYKACPTNAIGREVFITRQDIEEKNEDIEGKVEINREKCNLCGICAEFCEVFKMVEKEPTPEDVMPYTDILIDEEACDYCKLCEEVCPEEAIKVEGKRISFRLPEKIAEIKIEQDLCSHCGYCEEVCPYDAAKTIKPMEGKLSLFEARMARCDPVGCAACILICKHNKVWYVSKDKGKVHFNEKFCIYCGACENACPYDLIKVDRDAYFTKEVATDAPWREAWEDAVVRIVEKKRVEEPFKFFVEEVEVEIEEEEIVTTPPDEEELAAMGEKISRIEEILKKARYRRALESGDIDVFMRGVKRALGEDKG